MGYICQTQDKNEINNLIPLNIKYLENIVEDSFAYVILSNTFTVFLSIEKIAYLIYCNANNSIVCYDLEKEQKICEIKNPHEDYITNLIHYLYIKNNTDLIMTISLDDNNIRIWNAKNWESLLNIKQIYTTGYLYSACFLYDNSKLYIIASNFNLLNTPEVIKIYDFNGNKINEIDESNDITYIIDNYYCSALSKNYIITGNLGFLKSYDFNKRQIKHKYFDCKMKIRIFSFIIIPNSSFMIIIMVNESLIQF